jgi:serine/threonine protein kinase
MLIFLVLFTTDANSHLAWKITDFGFSAMAGVSLPKPLSMGRMMRNYFAPELLISSRYNGKVDIWSAGCILYELATGCAAFPDDEAVRKYAWSGSHAPLVADNRAGLGVEIEERVGEMLNISPEMRPDATTVLKNIPVESSPIC